MRFQPMFYPVANRFKAVNIVLKEGMAEDRASSCLHEVATDFIGDRFGIRSFERND